jgi:hypothetical protein
MVGEMYPTEEVDARSECGYEYFVWMQFELEMVAKKILYAWQKRQEPRAVCGKYDEVVGIADVVFGFERVLGELIKLIHVDVHEKLTGEVTERESFAGRGRMKTLDDVLQQGYGAFVREMSP